ncbi:MAG: hypothetical protein HC844_02425 [Tabrizicola sp.]|nr:hypothetical protein [Tabrizicola sp.]
MQAQRFVAELDDVLGVSWSAPTNLRQLGYSGRHDAGVLITAEKATLFFPRIEVTDDLLAGIATAIKAITNEELQWQRVGDEALSARAEFADTAGNKFAVEMLNTRGDPYFVTLSAAGVQVDITMATLAPREAARATSAPVPIDEQTAHRVIEAFRLLFKSDSERATFKGAFRGSSLYDSSDLQDDVELTTCDLAGFSIYAHKSLFAMVVPNLGTLKLMVLIDGYVRRSLDNSAQIRVKEQSWETGAFRYVADVIFGDGKIEVVIGDYLGEPGTKIADLNESQLIVSVRPLTEADKQPVVVPEPATTGPTKPQESLLGRAGNGDMHDHLRGLWLRGLFADFVERYTAGFQGSFTELAKLLLPRATFDASGQVRFLCQDIHVFMGASANRFYAIFPADGPELVAEDMRPILAPLGMLSATESRGGRQAIDILDRNGNPLVVLAETDTNFIKDSNGISVPCVMVSINRLQPSKH